MRRYNSAAALAVLLSQNIATNSAFTLPMRLHNKLLKIVPQAGSHVRIHSARLLSSIPFVDPPVEENPAFLPLGAVKYEMAPLPDSLVETTVFVGNLGDFVNDDTLSDLFARVATANASVPAVVARKPNNHSMGYGFVTFRTNQEREAAIDRFHGYNLEGKRIKVEAIKIDGPRPRVPEKLLFFTLGSAKPMRRGKTNTLRTVTNLSHQVNPVLAGDSKTRKQKALQAQIKRISKDDVERLSRGQPAKRKGYGSRSVPHRLNELERAAFERAEVHGYVTVDGSQQGYRRTRKGSPLANIHRQWCDARAKPQIILAKASTVKDGWVVDHVLVDLSPLRCVEEEFLIKFQTDILSAATNSGMVLTSNDMFEDNDNQSMCEEDDQECVEEEELMMDTTMFEFEMEDWATRPIWQLPVMNVGVFEGDRTKAKAMAKELATLWDTREPKKAGGVGIGVKTRKDAGARGGGKTQMKGLSQHRAKSS